MTGAALEEGVVAAAMATVEREGGVVLEVVDREPPGRRSRWYRIAIQPVLLGPGVDVIREWGRRPAGDGGRRLVSSHLDEAAAVSAAAGAVGRRLRRGYLLRSGSR